MGYLEDQANLAGKVAIIVGGGGGLGRACSLALAKAGVHVGIADRDAEALAQTAKEAEAAGVRVLTQVLDARNPDELTAFFEAMDAEFDNQLNILVNIIGGGFPKPFMETSPNAWDAIMRINFTWLIRSVYLGVERMKPLGGGSIINMSTVEAHRSAPGWSVYSGMKAGVVAFSRSMAVELGRDNIRLNTIDPDHFPTDASMKNHPDQGGSDAAEKLRVEMSIPMARYGTDEDLGGPLLFLASDLSKYVTGTSTLIDGGTIAAAGWFDWPGKWFENMVPKDVAQLILDAGDGSSNP